MRKRHETRQGERSQKLRELTLEFCRDKWVTTNEVAAALGSSPQTARKPLRELVEVLRIEEKTIKNCSWFKTVPDGYIPPLYQSAMDARPLAETWGGYTFLNSKATGEQAWHP